MCACVRERERNHLWSFLHVVLHHFFRTNIRIFSHSLSLSLTHPYTQASSDISHQHPAAAAAAALTAADYDPLSLSARRQSVYGLMLLNRIPHIRFQYPSNSPPLVDLVLPSLFALYMCLWILREPVRLCIPSFKRLYHERSF